jgi:hypothetical protein
VKPKIGHLRIFGCLVYIHVLVEERMKLEPSEEKGIFMGYNETSKPYRIFITAQRKIVVSRDVKFKENLAARKSHELTPVAEDEEQVAQKEEKGSQTSNSRSHPSGGEEDLAPSSAVRRPR